MVTIVTDAENDATMITSLIALKKFVDDTVASSFTLQPISTHVVKKEVVDDEDVEMDEPAPAAARDPLFVYAVRDAFESGFTARKNKPAEMIGK